MSEKPGYVPNNLDQSVLPPRAGERHAAADPTTIMLSLPRRVDYTKELDRDKLSHQGQLVADSQIEILGRVDGLLDNLSESLPNLVHGVRSQAGGFVAAVMERETEKAKGEDTQKPRAYAAKDDGFIPKLFTIYWAGWIGYEDALSILRAYIDGVEETAREFPGDVVSLRLGKGGDRPDFINAISHFKDYSTIQQAGNRSEKHFLLAGSEQDLLQADRELRRKKSSKVEVIFHKVGVPYGTREMWRARERVRAVLERVQLNDKNVVPVVSGSTGEELTTKDEILEELEALATAPDNKAVVDRELKQRGGRRKAEITAKVIKRALERKVAGVKSVGEKVGRRAAEIVGGRKGKVIFVASGLAAGAVAGALEGRRKKQKEKKDKKSYERPK